ncbi:MAG: hypothetical protein CMI90_03305 [Pelagibacteraceae bacterium]|nr:hypothetical protein [Pelagibacteraceae bacterium]
MKKSIIKKKHKYTLKCLIELIIFIKVISLLSLKIRRSSNDVDIENQHTKYEKVKNNFIDFEGEFDSNNIIDLIYL